MDQLKQEVHELRGEVTILRAEVEKLNSLVSSLTVMQDQPVCPKRPRQQSFRQVILQNRAPRQLILQNKVPRQFIPQNQVRKASQCDPIPLKYADLLPILFKPGHLLRCRMCFLVSIALTSFVPSIKGHQVMTLSTVIL